MRDEAIEEVLLLLVLRLGLLGLRETTWCESIGMHVTIGSTRIESAWTAR